MQHGYFDDKRREYVIARPDTPVPWYNYIRNDEWCGLVSNTGGGPSFHRDAKYRRFLRYRYNNIPADRPGRYVYLRDNASGDYWSATWAPVQKPLEKFKYECRVGLNYTIITSRYDGVETELTYFVAPDDAVELWRLVVTNRSRKRRRELSTFSYGEMCVWGALRDLLNLDNGPRCTRVEYRDGAIINRTMNDLGGSLGTQNWVTMHGYFTSSEEPAGYDADREYFIGPYRSEANPMVVETGRSNDHCENGGHIVCALQHRFALEPAQSKTIVYQLGMHDEPKRLPEIMARYRKVENVEAAFAKLKERWEETLGKFQVRTPDEEFNTCFNTWNQYQSTMTTFLSRSISPYEWGIGRGVGFRDTSQDLMGMTHAWPEYARKMLVMLMSVLWKDGAATHNFFPSTGEGQERDFNDDHLWLVLSACHYVKETGDTSLLAERVAYKDGAAQTGFEHLERALERTWGLVGKHGLPQIGHADWNDGLNNPGEMTSESVFDAMLFCAACREMVGLCEHRGKTAEAQKYRGYYEEMKKRVNEQAWDGQWYRRVLHARGGYGGGKGSKSGYIFVEPQPWAVISGVAEGTRAETTMASVGEHLATEYGIAILKEAFPEYDPAIGSISIVLPGIKENGSVFCHCNPWVIVAETVLGHGDRAMEYYKLTSYTTVNRRAQVHQVEPYVYSQHICLPPHKHVGRAGNPWLTGSAGWFMQAMAQYMLGIRPTYAGLMLDPCVPQAWKKWTVEREFRGARYRIRFENPEAVSKGVKAVTVDGKRIEGNVIPAYPAGTEHEVRVVMGAKGSGG